MSIEGEKVLVDRFKTGSRDAPLGEDDHFDRGHGVLVGAKGLAHSPFKLVALDRLAKGARGGDPQLGAVLGLAKIDHKHLAEDPFALFGNGHKMAPFPDAQGLRVV